MKLERLDHLVITTQNLDRCLEFYTKVLDMEPDIRNGRYAVKFGTQKINIHRRKGEFQPAAATPTYGSQDICLIAQGSIEDIQAELLEKGCTIEMGPVRRTGALGQIDSIYLRDPDKNLVEISVYPKST